MIKTQTHAKFILYGFIGLGTVVLMMPVSFRLSAIQHEFWNMGHAIAFAFVFAILPKAHPYFAGLSAKHYYLIAILNAALIALATESAQQFIPGRSISLTDMYLDVLGAFIGCTLYMLFKKSRQAKPAKYILCLLLAIIGLLYPSHVVFIDEHVKRKQFPVLSDLSYQSELRRWSGDNDKIICVEKGNISEILKDFQIENLAFLPNKNEIYSNLIDPSDLKNCGIYVPILDKKYSGVFLRFLSPNWSTHSKLKIELYTEKQGALTFRVDDYQHGLSFDYTDRFNQMIIVEPGLNIIEFDITSIKFAPETRQMNMQEVASLGIISTAPHDLTSFVVFEVSLQ